MKRLNICIDIDGTVTDPYYWLPRANDYFGRKVKPQDVTSYKIHEILGVEAKEYDEFYRRFGPMIHLESKIRDGVQEVISELFKNHLIHFVTARDEKMRYVSLEWLKKHRIPMDSISILGNPNKIRKAQELNSDFFIEDSYDNAIQLANAGFEILLIDCTYNRGPIPPNVTRLYNWNQIYRIITKRSEILETQNRKAM